MTGQALFKLFEMTSFDKLGLSGVLLRNIRQLGFTEPSSVQKSCIPPILQGRDVIGIANTGSGKTAAFALPVVHVLSVDPHGVFALCLSPTRELAYQIAEQFAVFSVGMSLRCEVVIGGEDLLRQASSLSKRPHIVVATPGRLLEHFMHSSDTIECFQRLKFLILDEADRLLDSSFEAELRYLLTNLPQKRQTLMFSATITPSVIALKPLLGQRAFYYEEKGELTTPTGCAQYYCFMPEKVKDTYLVHVLRELVSSKSTRAMIFCPTVQKCEMVSHMLHNLGIAACSLHAAKKQRDRHSTLNAFKSTMVKILVATDVAARGLDLPDVELVVNYDIPSDPRQYIHRIGRTARFHATGQAISLVTQYDVGKIKKIEKHLGHELEEFQVQEADVNKLVGEVFASRKMAKLHMASPGGFDEQLSAKKKRQSAK